MPAELALCERYIVFSYCPFKVFYMNYSLSLKFFWISNSILTPDHVSIRSFYLVGEDGVCLCQRGWFDGVDPTSLVRLFRSWFNGVAHKLCTDILSSTFISKVCIGLKWIINLHKDKNLDYFSLVLLSKALKPVFVSMFLLHFLYLNSYLPRRWLWVVLPGPGW